MWGKKSLSTVCSCLARYHQSTHLPMSPSKTEVSNSGGECMKEELKGYYGKSLPCSLHLIRCKKPLNDFHSKWTFVSCTTEHFG